MRFAALLATIYSAAVLLVFVFAQGGEGGDADVENPGAGHGPPDIESEFAGRDDATGVEFQRFTVQGVTVLIPSDGGKDWISNLNTDGCDPLRAQYFVVEHVPSGVRFRVDLQDNEIRFKGAPSADVEKVADVIRRSLEGKFEGDARLSGTPRPIPTDCDDRVQDDIPPVEQAFEPSDVPVPDRASPLDATSTPAPMPTPIIEN